MEKKQTTPQLYAVMGTEHETRYGTRRELAEDELLVKRIVISDPNVFKTGDAFLTAYCQHWKKLNQERAELEAQKKPIEQRLKEIRDEMQGLREYSDSINDRLNPSAPTFDPQPDIDSNVFVAQDNYQYNGKERPGLYRHIQKMIKKDDLWHIAYADEEVL